MDDQDQPRKRVKLSEDANGGAPVTAVPATSNDSEVQRELKAGISAYTAPQVRGFSGILKQRYANSSIPIRSMLKTQSQIHRLPCQRSNARWTNSTPTKSRASKTWPARVSRTGSNRTISSDHKERRDICRGKRCNSDGCRSKSRER